MAELHDSNTSAGDNDLFHTARGMFMKQSQKQIVTGMDKLVNPKGPSEVDTIFDSSPSRDINVGEVRDQGGIQYKAVNNGNPLK